ncbi:hypothetical protein CDL15_Pgr018270 [Punica granatum]|uniref:Uncharacterized protein n=1 Tax=Punica granatum TaxID=22663 RepID=A0A218WHT8_PUNGR|nr:hypothetical protein CDL15_Pgr018270 [Punica granatum]
MEPTEPPTTIDDIIDQTKTLSCKRTTLRLSPDPTKTPSLSKLAYGKIISYADLSNKTGEAEDYLLMGPSTWSSSHFVDHGDFQFYANSKSHPQAADET